MPIRVVVVMPIRGVVVVMPRELVVACNNARSRVFRSTCTRTMRHVPSLSCNCATHATRCSASEVSHALPEGSCTVTSTASSCSTARARLASRSRSASASWTSASRCG